MSSDLELTEISKSFAANRVLENVSLRVEAGEFVSLVGPSGCGKSTLLRIIAGLEVQGDGHVRIGGRQVDHLGPRARNIAMVFQNYALYPHMSAFDNIALPLSVGRLSLAERLPLVKYLSPRRARIERGITADVKSVAAQLQIEPLLARKPGQLSGGQRQRVALARAMVRQPTLFLMDEPLSNLDAQLRVHMRDELADLHQRLGATFIYVTHDQVEAMTMSSRVAMMDRGRLAQVGKPRELYETPATIEVARFIGSPMINVLPVRIEAGGRVALDGQPLAISTGLAEGSTASLGIRPEALHFVPVASAGAQFTGRVRRVEHHGAERLVYVDRGHIDSAAGAGASAGSVIVRVAGAASAAVAGDGELGVGQVVALAVDHARAHVFDQSGHRVGIDAERSAVPSHVDQAPLSSASWQLTGAAAS